MASTDSTLQTFSPSFVLGNELAIVRFSNTVHLVESSQSGGFPRSNDPHFPQ